MGAMSKLAVLVGVTAVTMLGASTVIQAQLFRARDPGLRPGPPAAGGYLAGLTSDERTLFQDGLDEFSDVDGVGEGLGPRFNLDSCLGCHSQPAAGGSAPAVNPQVAVATAFGARNVVPSFITLTGPVREARFKFKPDGTRDGGVHALFVISGRRDSSGDARGCAATQEDFDTQVRHNNVSFRIPTPTFGLGLVELIPDRLIATNQSANAAAKNQAGITGRPNRNGNDGTITRFGWKAQNKSLLLFSGEAYNVEMGLSNELFPSERDETPSCQFKTVPNTITAVGSPSNIEKFAFFMRFLAPPSPSTGVPGGAASIAHGRQLFTSTGCYLCHTPTLRTGDAVVTALANRDLNLYSDLLLHGMGPELADDIYQAEAGPDEFRTAPLWGLGQRIFLLHDGRTTDLLEAVRAHRSAGNGRFRASEANVVIDRYNALNEHDKQDLLNFLRSL